MANGKWMANRSREDLGMLMSHPSDPSDPTRSNKIHRALDPSKHNGRARGTFVRWRNFLSRWNSHAHRSSMLDHHDHRELLPLWTWAASGWLQMRLSMARDGDGKIEISSFHTNLSHIDSGVSERNHWASLSEWPDKNINNKQSALSLKKGNTTIK